MTKLYLCDDLGGGAGGYKTTKELIKYLKTKYEFQYGMYWDAKLTDWADITVCEWTANNAVQLSTWAQSGVSYDWSKKKLIVRAMDIEVWANQHTYVNWDHINRLAYTAKHIWGKMQAEHDFTKHPHLNPVHIPLSVDLNEWTYADRKPGKNIAVVGKMWAAKSPEMVFQFADLLKRMSGQNDWKIHILGSWEQGTWGWMQAYRDNIIKALGLENNIVLVKDFIPDLNKWYDQMNYLVTFSQKDSFSLCNAEVMAKGIKAFPHEFWGATDIWGKYVWSSLTELVNEIVKGDYNSQEYHDFIKNNYSNDIILKKWDEIIEITG